MIFQLQQNGAPGFMRPFMTDDGRKANIQFFYPDHKGDTIVYATHFAEEFIEQNPLGEVIDPARRGPRRPARAASSSKGRLLDIWYYMLGPLLPPRHHTLTVQIRQKDGTYVEAPVNAGRPTTGCRTGSTSSASGAIEDYEDERDRSRRASSSPGPTSLADWDDERRRPLVGERGVRHPRRRDRDQEPDRRTT